jgi:hypothetical protein
VHSLTIDPTGRFLYVPAFGKVAAYSVDFLSGNLFTVPGSPFTTASANATYSVAVDPTGRFAYVTGGIYGFDGRAAIFSFRIEANGALTPVPGSPVVLPPRASVGVIATAVRRPFISLKVNGQHPTPPTVTVTGPTQLTLDVSRGTFDTPVDWYWALYYNHTLYWVTSDGLATTPAPWFNAPPADLTNVTLLDFTLPPASTITNILYIVNGTATVSFDSITAMRP